MKKREPMQKCPKLPHWITTKTRPAGAIQPEEEPHYNSGHPAFWRFRAIHHPLGLDYVPGRGGYLDGEHTTERAEFIKAVLDSKVFAEWVKDQTGSSDEVFCADGNLMHLRATNNRSYGYTYLWAYWMEG